MASVEFAASSKSLVIQPSILDHQPILFGSKLKKRKLPDSEDLERLVTGIENGATDNLFMNWVRSNPGLLVSESNLPVVVVDSLRYNALHVAAQNDNWLLLCRVLCLLNMNRNVLKKRESRTDSANVERIVHITDRYLNTPCDLFGDTPLHMAAKFLAVNCVKVLISHPLTDKDFKNREGKTAFEVVGEDAPENAENFEQDKQDIKEMLKDYYFVPLWKDINGLEPPVVGVKATIQELGNAAPKDIVPFFPNHIVRYFPECSEDVLPQSSLVSGTGVEFPSRSAAKKWVISSIIGPVTTEQASHLTAAIKLTSGRGGKLVCNQFLKTPEILRDYFTKGNFKKFKTCNKVASGTLSPLKPTADDLYIRLTDSEMGLERIAKKYAEALGIRFRSNYTLKLHK